MNLFRSHHLLAAWLSVFIACASLAPESTWANTGSSGNTSTSSFWASFLSALQDWLTSNSSGSSGSGRSGDEEEAAADQPTNPPTSNTTSTSNPAPTTSSPAPTTNTVQPTALAARIAGDAGGNANQYALYAEKLSETLNKLTPAQRARVFSGK